jgi:hypothetical protein
MRSASTSMIAICSSACFRLPDAITCADERLVACHAGARPNSGPTINVAATQNAERHHAHVEGERQGTGQEPLRNHRWRDIQNRRAAPAPSTPLWLRAQGSQSEADMNEARPARAHR